MAGKIRPDTETLKKLIQPLSDSEGAELLEGFLLDSIPQGLKYLVSVGKSQNTIHEEIPFPDLFRRLRESSRDTLTEIARLCLLDPETAEMYRRVTKSISPHWAKRLGERDDEAIIKSAGKSLPQNINAAHTEDGGAEKLVDLGKHSSTYPSKAAKKRRT